MLTIAFLTGCTPAADEGAALAAKAPQYRAFHDPRKVTVRGYDGEDLMEPFISADGRYLLFNNRNDARENTNLHFAERIDDLTFYYRGELSGVNTQALEAVPSMDRDNNLYFISTRSYDTTWSTLYHGNFDDGLVSNVALVPGVSRHTPGQVTFDATISADGNTLFLVDGVFSGGQLPQSADIAMALRDGTGFRRLPPDDAQLKNVNTPNALEYAPAVSIDLLELYFTRFTPVSRKSEPVIFRAARKSISEPFGMPERVAAITGFAEAPALSPDGRSLYYVLRDEGRFAIYRVVR